MPRKQRRRAWGSITEAMKGKKYVLRWVENTSRGRRRCSETFYGTYREASARLDQIHVSHSDDRPVPTVGQASDMWYVPWLNRRVADKKTKEGTRTEYMRMLDDVVLPRWGNTPVDSLAPVDIQEWLLTLRANEASIAIVVLRKLMDFPVQYEIVETNKFRLKYEMPVRKATTKSRNIYTLEDARRMFEIVKGSMCEASFILACFGSARLGESLGVRRSEVEMAECNGMKFAIVPIVRRVPRNGSDVLEDGDLKTPQSMRDLVIPEPYGTRLLEIASTGTVPESPWLAPQHNGSTMSCGMLSWYWRKAADDRHIPFSNLRTSWRTFAQYEWGVDYDTCEVLMGHKLAGVTGSSYLKPTRQQLIEAVANASHLGKIR